VQRIAGMRNTHERMANDMGLMVQDETLIAYSIQHERGAIGLSLMARAKIARRAGRARKARGDECGFPPCRARLAGPAETPMTSQRTAMCCA
jgi:hypothetical protein